MECVGAHQLSTTKHHRARRRASTMSRSQTHAQETCASVWRLQCCWCKDALCVCVLRYATILNGKLAPFQYLIYHTGNIETASVSLPLANNSRHNAITTRCPRKRLQRSRANAIGTSQTPLMADASFPGYFQCSVD